MNQVYVTLRSGSTMEGTMWEWVPRQGYFTLTENVSGDVIRVDLADVAQARETEVRVTREGPEDVDLLHRARMDGWIEIKQVLVFRKDLKMRTGKIAAQCAHASMKVFVDRSGSVGIGPEGEVVPHMLTPLTTEMNTWLFGGKFAKIVLSVDAEEDLLEVYRLAQEANLPCALIVDAGYTEFHGVPTKTTLAIGPALSSEIDKITGPTGAVKTKLA